jgi:hypothetical protein
MDGAGAAANANHHNHGVTAARSKKLYLKHYCLFEFT